ncbi:OB-fold nucleic acid binding domain-containing protein [Paracoccaceae bacterium]|jgi:DNA polymerase III alpha subunit|nr:OB-fold nucleic acid binding domain-containing protein [Paracoccaceae bacterium]
MKISNEINPKWPQPPSALPHNLLSIPPNGSMITVAGLVLVRQKPGTASGVVFLTLEDEFGVSNIIVWPNIFKKFRNQVIGGRMLKITGKLQREDNVTHIIANYIEDISIMLDELLSENTT